MINNYRSAGVYNIVCAVLYMASCIVSVSFLEMDFTPRSVDLAEELRVLYMIIYWTMILGFPFIMTLTGGMMLFKQTKGAGTRVLIVFTDFLKVCGIVYNVIFGCMNSAKVSYRPIVGGVILWVVAILMAFSVTSDIQALYKDV